MISNGVAQISGVMKFHPFLSDKNFGQKILYSGRDDTWKLGVLLCHPLKLVIMYAW